MALMLSSEQQLLSLAHVVEWVHAFAASLFVIIHAAAASVSQLAQPCSERPRKRHIATTMIMFDFAMAPLYMLGDDLSGT